MLAKFFTVLVGQHVTRACQESIEHGGREQGQRCLGGGRQQIQETSDPFDSAFVSPQKCMRRGLRRHDICHERNNAL